MSVQPRGRYVSKGIRIIGFLCSCPFVLRLPLPFVVIWFLSLRGNSWSLTRCDRPNRMYVPGTPEIRPVLMSAGVETVYTFFAALSGKTNLAFPGYGGAPHGPSGVISEPRSDPPRPSRRLIRPFLQRHLGSPTRVLQGLGFLLISRPPAPGKEIPQDRGSYHDGCMWHEETWRMRVK